MLLDGDGAEPTPVENALPFDPVTPRRLWPVAGLMVTLELKLLSPSMLEVRVHDGTDWVRWIFHGNEGRCEVRARDEVLGEFHWKPQAGWSSVGVSTFDRHASTWAANPLHEPLSLPGRDSGESRQFLDSPIELRALGAIEVRNLHVWRDLFPTAPRGGGRDWELGRALESDEYLVLGDNFPVSIDSRQSQRGVRREEIVGVIRPWTELPATHD